MTKLQLKSTLSKEKQVEIDKLKNPQKKPTDQKTTLEDIKKAVKWLMDTWPLLFSDKADKPSKIGIHNDILEEKSGALPCSKNVLRRALSYYVGNPAYLNNTLVSWDYL